MITAERVREICSALRVAGAGWPDIARRLPEFGRLSLGRPVGPGLVRPWVLLNEEHEEHDAPVRLVRHENGVWFPKGAYLVDVERMGHERTTDRPGHAPEGTG